MERVNVGVIGVGRMGARHARNLAGVIPGARLVAVADADGVRVRQVQQELDVPHGFTDYRELVHLPALDAVVIAAPATDREAMIRECVAARRHMFCEKPVAVDLETTGRIRALLADSGLKFQLGFMRRFDPGYAHAYQQIQAGAIGSPVLLRATSRDTSGPPLEYIRTSGGLFADSTIHDFDLARWLMGDEVARVYAQGGVFCYPEYRSAGDVDTGTVSLTYRNGGLGLLDNVRHSGYGYDIRTEVLGTEGALQIGYLHQHPVVRMTDGRVSHDCVPGFLERFADAYRLELEHFIDCLQRDVEPSVGVRDGERALLIARAALTSLQRGEPVAVPGDDAAADPARLGVA